MIDCLLTSPVVAAFSATARTHGNFDVIVDNAAYNIDAYVSVDQTSLEFHWDCFEVNVKRSYGHHAKILILCDFEFQQGRNL